MRVTLVVLTALLLLPATALAGDRVVTWTPAMRADGSVKKVGPKARSIRLSVSFGVCDVDQDKPISRVDVDRKAKKIVITVHLRTLDVGPYTICNTLARSVTRKVKLGGKRGSRKLVDGATGKTRVPRR